MTPKEYDITAFESLNIQEEILKHGLIVFKSNRSLDVEDYEQMSTRLGKLVHTKNHVLNKMMSSIDYLNEFLNSSLPFPFYQRLNALFNGISNKDTPLSIGRSILARWGPGTWPGAAGPARQNASAT